MTDPELTEPHNQHINNGEAEEYTNEEQQQEANLKEQKQQDLKRQLFVGNLANETTEKDITEKFVAAGPIEKVTVTSRGYAFVLYVDEESVGKAVESFNGSDLKGSELKVENAKPARTGFRNRGRGRGRGGRGRGGRGRGSFRGGRGGRMSPRKPRRDLSNLAPEEYSKTGLFCANLPFNATDEELAALFENFTLASAHVVKRQFDGAGKGFGFVELANPGDQAAAVKEVTGKQLKSRTVTIKVAVLDQERKKVGGKDEQKEDEEGGDDDEGSDEEEDEDNDDEEEDSTNTAGGREVTGNA